MGYRLGKRSRRNLIGVHSDLVIVMSVAILDSPIDFSIIEGPRTLARQRKLLDDGATTTLKSRHLPVRVGDDDELNLRLSHAVDIAPYVDGSVRWDWPLFDKLAPHIKRVAADLGVPIEWGGDWTRFRDGPHWQLPRRQYPGA